jgi:hypothetical protein
MRDDEEGRAEAPPPCLDPTQETELFVEDLADYVRGSQAVQEMIAERTRASAALADGLANVERLRVASGALQANPSPANAQKRTEVEAELAAAQVAVSEARAYYDRAAASVISELERYRAGMRVDFKAMFTRFLAAQVCVCVCVCAWRAYSCTTDAPLTSLLAVLHFILY